MDSIEETFGLVQVDSLPILDDLLAYPYQVDEYQIRYLTDIAQKYVTLGGDN